MRGFERNGRSETVLVVEDAEAIRKMVCVMLAQSGYRCLEASDGREALRLLEACLEPVHLVLTDMLMPSMSGPELAKQLSSLRPHLRILFMSGCSGDLSVQSVETITPVFLSKPFTAADLTGKVRQALDGPWPGQPASGSCDPGSSPA